MSIKCATELLDRFVVSEIAVEVTHRSARRLFGLAEMAEVCAATTAPRRPMPGRGRGRLRSDRLPPDRAGRLADYAARKRVPQALIVEAALASHLSPDGADRLEAALARRLDRMTRHLERIERHVDISNEAMAVFVRFWLTSTPALPDAALAAAQTTGRERLRDSSKRSGGGWPADEGWLMRSAETSMQKHLAAKSNERATQSSRQSGNQWPGADWLL